MALELPGVTVIEHPHEARARARRWDRMARELDTDDAPPEAKEKARELRQRSKAAHDWARRQEDALDRGQQAHDTTAAETASNGNGSHPAAAGETPASSSSARAAGHAAYQAARPQAMRVGKHVFQGLQEPFGPVSDAWSLFWEAIGVTLGLILLTDLIKAPRGIVDVTQHASGALNRLVGLSDPLGGLAAGGAAAGSTRTARPSGSRPPGVTGPVGLAGGFLPAGAVYKPGRHDQGQDFQTNPGGAIIAPGAGVVVAVRSDPHGFGPSYPIVRFTSGPYAGRTLYIGHTISVLQVGAHFLAGAILSHTGRSPIGNATVPGWAEIGYAPNAVPGQYGQQVPF